MKNEIDNTVERIGQLPDNAEVALDANHACSAECDDDSPFHRDNIQDLKALCTAYTQLKADLATAKQGLDLEMAEQQFTGYRYAEQNSGRSIIGLCEAMGLTEKEWTAVRERVQWLGKSNIEDIDEHFEEQNDER